MTPIPDAVVEAALNAAHGSRDIPLHLWPEAEQWAMRAALEAAFAVVREADDQAYDRERDAFDAYMNKRMGWD